MTTTSTSELSALQMQLEKLKRAPLNKKAFVGFDGFVDTIKKPVRQKLNYTTIHFNAIQDFSLHLHESTEMGCQIEMERQQIKLGGNGPILSNALGALGVHNFCLGSMGYPEKHKVFNYMNSHCTVMSALNPAENDAVEFENGKIIFSDLTVFESYDWNYLKETIGLAKIKEAILQSNLLAFVDWSNLPYASNIWDGVLHEIIKPSGKNNFMFLFDLADPSKKSTEQIDEVLDLISCFSPYGSVTLALNEHEALKIWDAINGDIIQTDNRKYRTPEIREAGKFIYNAMTIDYLLIHPINRVLLYHNREVLEMAGRVISKPKVLTGGGDNLNAGYCLGLLAGLTPPQCMVLGMATSASYIEHGISPNLSQLIKYLKNWSEELNTVSADFSDDELLIHH